jgi:hypothetical protein
MELAGDWIELIRPKRCTKTLLCCRTRNVESPTAGWSEALKPEVRASGSGSPPSSLRTTSKRMQQNGCLFVLAFLPLPLTRW